MTDFPPNSDPVINWKQPPLPPREPMTGRLCRVEPLDLARHAEELHKANLEDEEGRNWDYMAYGPFETLEDYRAWMRQYCTGDDPFFHAIVDAETGRAIGVASYLRIDPKAGSIEVGHINYAPALQRTRAATEAMHMMMARAFDLGYRRYEWKCNAANAGSRRAALRLGFTFEGVHRQHMVAKGRNRDTAWYSILDKEWRGVSAIHRAWLDDGNFDARGRQKLSLTELMRQRE